MLLFLHSELILLYDAVVSFDKLVSMHHFMKKLIAFPSACQDIFLLILLGKSINELRGKFH